MPAANDVSAAGSAAGPVALRHWPWLALLPVAWLLLPAAPWQEDLSALTPLPREVLERDAGLRAAAGAPDMRWLLVGTGSNRDAALAASADIRVVLDRAVDDGLLAGHAGPDVLVPPRATQQARQRALRAALPGLAARVESAARAEGFAADAFGPFVEDVRRAAGAAPVTADTWRHSPLQGVVGGALVPPATPGGAWQAHTRLGGVVDGVALAARVAAHAGAAGAPGRWQVVDLKAASTSLATRYRVRMMGVLAVAAPALALLLLVVLRQPGRVLRIVGTLVATVGLAMALAARLLGGLSLFDLVALVLVAGLGLDYALFASRPDRGPAWRDTRFALCVCAASSLLVFTLLGASGIPILRGIGTTVALGVLCCFTLALGGRRSGWRGGG